MRQTLKRLAVIGAAALLSGCGFTPMHGQSASGAFGNTAVELAPNIKVDDKEAGFWAQQRLTERMGAQESAATILELKPALSRRGIGVSGQDVSTRYDLSLTLNYVLRDAASGKVLDRGNVRAVSTFTASSDPYALIAAEKGTTRQLASDAADRLLTRIAGYYASKK